MKKWTYYNEHDPFAAQWLRNLIAAGHVAPGDIDERSIEDVAPVDLAGYRQCHFFAGIGIWSLALRRAGWPDDSPVWTGSCPCQPFSAAGKGAGFADERHLWPAWHYLIEQCEPPVVFGEQVAGRDGLAWLDLVQADMEGLGYACGPVVAPAAGFGAPHKRERLYFVAYADQQDQSGRGIQRSRQSDGAGDGSTCERSEGLCTTGRVADLRGAGRTERRSVAGNGQTTGAGSACLVGDAESVGRIGRADDGDAGRRERASGQTGAAERPGPVNGGWGSADWLYCRDGRWRPVEPGTFPLAPGLPAGMGRLPAGLRRLAEMAGIDGASLKRAKAYRVGGLKGYGNGLCAPHAEAFIRAAIGMD